MTLSALIFFQIIIIKQIHGILFVTFFQIYQMGFPAGIKWKIVFFSSEKTISISLMDLFIKYFTLFHCTVNFCKYKFLPEDVIKIP